MPSFGTRKLKLFVEGTDYSDEVSNVEVTSEESDSDFISFEDAASGGARDYKLKITMKQNSDSTALWHKMWAAGGTDVSYEVWPNGGGVTPSLTTPKYSGTVTIIDPDGTLLGGEANASNTAQFVTEVEWPMTGRPVESTSA